MKSFSMSEGGKAEEQQGVRQVAVLEIGRSVVFHHVSFHAFFGVVHSMTSFFPPVSPLREPAASMDLIQHLMRYLFFFSFSEIGI